jgi:hypothetical protein
MSSCLVQKYGDDQEVHDEIIIQGARIADAVEEFEARGYRKWLESEGGPGVIIYGDATGSHRDTRSKSSDYGLLREYGFNVQKIRRSNPPIRHRHNSANGRLRNALGVTHTRIHPRAKTLIRGLEMVGYKANSFLEDEIEEQHVTAAWSYFCEREWPYRKYVDSEETRRWR